MGSAAEERFPLSAFQTAEFPLPIGGPLTPHRPTPIATVQPWFTDALKRTVKTPKLHFLDSGLLANVRELTFNRVKANRGTSGALLL